MKLLEIKENCGYFRNTNGEYVAIDKIGKDDLLALVTWALEEADVEFDPYDENTVKNHAHQIVYKSVVQKLQSLRGRRQEFADEAARLFLEDYEKYKNEVKKGSEG